MEISLENLSEDTGLLRVNLNTGKLNSFGRSIGYCFRDHFYDLLSVLMLTSKTRHHKFHHHHYYHRHHHHHHHRH